MSDSKIAEWPRPPAEDEVRRMLDRARGGDPTSLPALRQALDGNPGIWRAYGDLAGLARDAWINLIAGQDLVLKESMARQIEAMRADLAGPSPSPLEALLVDRILTCSLQLGHADAAMAQAGDVSIRQGEYARKRQDSAHRRYLMAVGALAMTRRLLGSAAGSSGSGSKNVSSSTGPGKLTVAEPLNDGAGDPESIRAEGDPAAADLVLEFGPPCDKLLGGNATGRPRRSRTQSRS